MTYTRRVVDGLLDDLFPHLAAVALEGAKGIGKTATALQRAVTTVDLSLPEQRRTLAGNLGVITSLAPPVFVDEWQIEPDVWDVIKHAVDTDGTGGRFLLAGSATPAPGVRLHSGAGRIVRLTMRPMSIAEREISQPTVSLAALLRGERPDIAGTCDLTLIDYVDEILASGFPGLRALPSRARERQFDTYLQRIVDRDLPEAGFTVRRPAALLSWLRAYGAATATDTTYSKILDAATPGEGDKPTLKTVGTYREHLARLFVLDPVPAWEPALTPLKTLKKTPKHHLVDPALAARIVRVGKDGLLRGEGQRVGSGVGTWLGALFESLATQSIRVYADGADATVGHLRTLDTSREIDLIVEGDDRKIVALEVKLADSVTDHDVRHLNWLHEQLGDRLVERVVITTGHFAVRRSDGVAVIPLALLGP